MPIDEQEFKRLKRRAEEARTAKDQATGQLESATQRLKDEFGCKDLKAAEITVKTLETEAAEAEALYDKAVEEFEKAWGGMVDV